MSRFGEIAHALGFYGTLKLGPSTLYYLTYSHVKVGKNKNFKAGISKSRTVPFPAGVNTG